MEKYSSEDKYSIFPKLAGFFLLVLLIVSASLWAFRESKVTAELQRSTYVLIMRADALLSELKDAETGQRGFLLLGDERYLEPYLLVADKIGGHLEELNQLTLSSTGRKHLDAIMPLVKAKMAEMASLIDLRRTRDLTAVIMAIGSGEGKRLMDLIRDEISYYIQLEEVALNQQNADFRTNMRYMFVAIITSSLLMLLFLIALTVSDRKRLQMEREKSFGRFQKIASQIPGVVFQFHLRNDGSSCFPYASEGIREIYRLSPEDVREDASTVFALLHPDESEEIMASIQASARDLAPWHKEYRVKFDDGSVRWLLGNALLQREVDGSTLWYGFITDITERKHTEEKLRLAASVFSHAWEGIMITEADGTIVEVNEAFSRITSYSQDEAQLQNLQFLSSGIQGKDFYATMWHSLLEKGHWYGEIWNRRKNGEVYAVMQTIGVVRDDQNNIRHYVAMFSDITLLKEHENELEHIAHYDALTKLPNRLLLDDRLRQGMIQVQRRSNKLAVVFLDLDGFKYINDTHGHEAGDQVLMVVANRLKLALREGDTLARLGGDEFIAVLLDLADTEESEPILTRMLIASAEPVQFRNIILQITASIGVSFYSQANNIDADQLLRQADQAMYQAKLAGKNRYHFFDTVQDSYVHGQHESLKRISHALNLGEFVLHYQPKVNMRIGTVVGAEALIRWQHPEKGLLLPSEFLPVIENHQLAVDIGDWVINTALVQIESWQALGLNIPISVNVGARQLQQANFVEGLSALLSAHPNVSSGCLEMEVLETSAMEDLMKVSRVIDASRKIGVIFALDDFGTGYSSLTYLKRLPVSQIKIDQSFVHGMLNDPDDQAIVEGVLGLASAFRLQVIAEGVETVEHGTLLLQLGCDLAQGYGIARPMPAEQLPNWVATWQPDPVWTELPSFNRNDLPLLFACVEHRAWIFNLEKYLKGECEAPQAMDIHQCRFGQWLDTEGLARYGSQPSFEVIERLHLQAHELVPKLCKIHDQDKNSEAALAMMAELNGLMDALLEQLKVMVQRGREMAEKLVTED